MDKIPCRVTSELNVYEREQAKIDRIQRAIESAAEPVFLGYMKNLETDDVEEALKGLTGDELKSLAEDLSMTDMRDIAHAGSILSDAVKRYCFQMAIKDVS